MVAAQHLVLFDKDDRQFGAGTAQGEGNQSPGQPAARDGNIDPAIRHYGSPRAHRAGGQSGLKDVTAGTAVGMHRFAQDTPGSNSYHVYS